MKQLLTNNHSTAPKQYLSNMFDATSEDGELCIARYDDGLAFGTALSEEDARYIEKYSMSWTKENYISVYERFETLVKSIESILQTGEVEKLDGELKEVYTTYLRPFDAEEEIAKKMNALINAKFDSYGAYVYGHCEDADFTEEEFVLLKKYEEMKREDYSARLGGGICASRVISCAQRLYRVMELGVPESILNVEKILLIDSMALHSFAKIKGKNS